MPVEYSANTARDAGLHKHICRGRARALLLKLLSPKKPALLGLKGANASYRSQYLNRLKDSAQAQPASIAVVCQCQHHYRIVFVPCITCANSAGASGSFGDCDRTKSCLGMAPLQPFNRGAPFSTGVNLQRANCSWPLVHCACRPLKQTMRGAVWKGILMGRLDAPAAYTASVCC